MWQLAPYTQGSKVNNIFFIWIKYIENAVFILVSFLNNSIDTSKIIF